MIEIWNQKHISKQGGISHINVLWKHKGCPEDFYMYNGIPVGYIMAKVIMNILLTRLSPFYES